LFEVVFGQVNREDFDQKINEEHYFGDHLYISNSFYKIRMKGYNKSAKEENIYFENHNNYSSCEPKGFKENRVFIGNL